MVRTKRYKYIRRYGDHPGVTLPNTDDCASKSLLLDHGWREREQLYDLVFDPHESDNVVARPGMTQVSDQMRQRLDDWIQETDDPLLSGQPLSPPPGGRINQPDQFSPRDPPTEIAP